MAKYFFDESKTKEFVNELVNQPEFDLLVGELFPEIPILNNKFKTRSKNQEHRKKIIYINPNEIGGIHGSILG